MQHSTKIKRTVLYYPTISIPNDAWVKQALFYFDEIASIVPAEVHYSGEVSRLLVSLSPALSFLREEGVYRPIPPDLLYIRQGWEVGHQLGDEFKNIVTSEEFRNRRTKRYGRVHRDKLSDGLVEFLESQGLLEVTEPGQSPYQSRWLQVEARTALLYMSFLAQYIADENRDLTVPATDRLEYERLLYGVRAPQDGLPGIETNLRAILPIPREDVAFKDILDFRERRKTELLRYRQRIDEFQQQLSQVRNKKEIKEVVVQFEEQQQLELSDLMAVLEDARIATIWGSLKTLIKADSPAFWGAGATALGVASPGTAIPVSWTLAGTTVSGVIEIGSYLVGRRNEQRMKLRESPFAYLYHAQREGVL